MRGKLQDFMKIIREDPAVDNVTGFTGGSRVNSGMMFITLKPRDQRHETAQQVIDRLRKKLANEPGANLFLMAVQDIRVGGRQSNASYQYTLLSDDLSALREWEPKIRKALAVGVILGIGALVGWRYWTSHQQDTARDASLAYEKATSALKSNTPEVLSGAEKFAADNKNTYGAFASLELAQHFVEQNDLPSHSRLTALFRWRSSCASWPRFPLINPGQPRGEASRSCICNS